MSRERIRTSRPGAGAGTGLLMRSAARAPRGRVAAALAAILLATLLLAACGHEDAGAGEPSAASRTEAPRDDAGARSPGSSASLAAERRRAQALERRAERQRARALAQRAERAAERRRAAVRQRRAEAAGVPPGASVLSGRITDIVDGDTVKAEIEGFETTIRVIGIDTPETRHPSRPVQCFGPEASAAMADLLAIGEEVRLVTDPSQDTRDRFDRLLAYVYPPGAAGPEGSANFALVASGHAKVYIYDGVPFAYADAFLRAEADARAAGRGLWGAPCHGDTEQADPASAPPPAPEAPAPAPAPAGGSCDPNYSGCVPVYPPDVNCADVDGPVQVLGSDPHRLDGDGDGMGCE